MNQLYAGFKKFADRTPDKAAIIYNDETISYGRLQQRVDRMAMTLQEQGISVNENVGLCMQKSPRFVVAYLSILKIGAAAVPVSTHSVGESVTVAIEKVNLTHMVVDESFSTRHKNCRFETDIVVAPQSPAGPIVRREAAETSGEAPCLILMTSGSTGIPKAVVVTQEQLEARIHAEVALFGLTDQDVILIDTPLYHCVGARMMLTAMLTGATLVLSANFTAHNWIETISRHLVTYTVAVPSQLIQIMDYSEKHDIRLREKLNSLKHLVSTSAYLNNETKNKMLSCFACRLYNLYASSETEYIAIYEISADDGKDNVLGRPIAGADIRILDSTGSVCEKAAGEILCAGERVFSAYYGDEDMTKSVFIGKFFKTGDVGFIDEDGLLNYIGRVKDSIISGGVNIYPADIEKVVLGLPEVWDCVALGVPDRVLGEVVGLIVQAEEDPLLLDRKIKRLCLDRLADYQVPRRIVVTKDTLRNDMGKLDKKRIRDAYLS